MFLSCASWTPSLPRGRHAESSPDHAARSQQTLTRAGTTKTLFRLPPTPKFSFRSTVRPLAVFPRFNLPTMQMLLPWLTPCENIRANGQIVQIGRDVTHSTRKTCNSHKVSVVCSCTRGQGLRTYACPCFDGLAAFPRGPVKQTFTPKWKPARESINKCWQPQRISTDGVIPHGLAPRGSLP